MLSHYCECINCVRELLNIRDGVMKVPDMNVEVSI